MRPPREIELKLDCEAPDLGTLSAHPLLHKDGASEPALLEARYFDTPDHALHGAGLSLRVRKEGNRFVQTLKAGSAAAGLYDRPEWEWELAGPDFDRAPLDSTPAARALEKAETPTLAPLFKTVVERTTRPIRHGESDIVVTLDSGRIETGKGDTLLCEIELELRDGRRADLFALARTLGETVPLRLGALTKAERGFSLITERLRVPSKAQPFAFDEGTTAGDAFVRIGQACLKHFRLNEAVFLQSRDPEALHQVRVALRRLRSAFTLFKPMLADDPIARELSGSVKQLSAPFGTARNLDVFLGGALADEIARRPEEAGPIDLRTRLEADREKAYAAVFDVLNGQPWRALLIDLVAWLETGGWRTREDVPHRDQPAPDFAAEVLERLRGRIKKRGRRLAKLEPEERHRVRIEAKKLRYGAEFFGPLFPKKAMRRRHKAFTGALSDLQDHLGALNDTATAHELADGLMGAEGGADAAASGESLVAMGLVMGEGASRDEEHLAAAAKARRALLDVKRFWR